MVRRTNSFANWSYSLRPLTAAVRTSLCSRRGGQLAPAAGLALLLACPAAGLAATFTVTTTDDAGAGSLRQAVLDANATAGADEILFDSSVTGDILLTSGALEITDALSIQGPGSDVLTLDANALSSVVVVRDALSVSGLTLANAAGNAIDAFADTTTKPLTVRDCVISGGTGSGISVETTDPSYCGITVIIEDSLITGNAAAGVVSALACYETDDSKLYIINSTISGNGGEGIQARTNTYCSEQVLRVEDSIISDNGKDGILAGGTNVYLNGSKVTGNGSHGVSARAHDDHYCRPMSSLSADQSVISENQGHGVWGAFLRIQNSTIANNFGTGVVGAGELDRVAMYTPERVDIAGTTITGNGAGGVFVAGDFYNGGRYDSTLTISNTTIAGNRSENDGAGIAFDPRSSGRVFDIRNTTISENSSDGQGGGISFPAPYLGDFRESVRSLTNTVIAGNSASANPDLALAVDSVMVDFSLIEEPGDSIYIETVPGSNLIGVDPLLGPLQDNGGSTLTYALLPGSPAIDRGDPAFAPPPDFDQRGEGYLRVVTGRVDMGAFESQSSGWLRALGDTNGDGAPEIAVVQRSAVGKNLATVRDVTDGSLISEFEFSDALSPLDVEAMPAFGSGDGAPGLVMLGSTPVRAETRDAFSGDLKGSIAFNSRSIPVDLTVLHDQTGNGAPELATLATASTKLTKPVGLTERVNLDTNGIQTNDQNPFYEGFGLSADGRFVVFSSINADLVPDASRSNNVYVHDRESGLTELVNINSDGVKGDGDSGNSAISANGRFISFASTADNLVPGDTNGAYDIYVHDRVTGINERVSVSSAGTQADDYSLYYSALSADGRFVTFESAATNLVPDDTNGVADIFVRDRATATTDRVNVNSTGVEANDTSSWPAISADGRFVAFSSNADNLVGGDTNETEDVFVHDRASDTTQRVSVSSSGAEAIGHSGSRHADISGDGRFVVYDSDAANLVLGDTNATTDVFVHDRQTGITERVNVNSSGKEASSYSSSPAISADGRTVAFQSQADNLVSEDNNGVIDIFVHDRETGTTERVSVDTCGAEGDRASASSWESPALNGDGLVVAFSSEAINLVEDDTNFDEDVFVRTRDLIASPPPGEPRDLPKCVVDEDSTRVEIRDAVTGDLVKNLWFGSRFDPHQAITLPDLNGNGSAEVGVVLAKADETDRLVIKDTATGANINTVGTWWQPELDLLQALPVTDAAGKPTANVAMLLRDADTGKILVRVSDARTNVTAATVRGYHASFVPVKLAQVPDINGNGLEEYALLARNPETGQVTAEVRDGSGGVSRMWFSSECTPLDFATVADINGNGADELVMLGRCGTDGTLKAVVKDAKSGETLRRMAF